MPPSVLLAELVGQSAAMVAMRATLCRLGPTTCNVLIAGETGTGKEIVAQLLHDASRRRAKPFVPINCSAVPETLFESELFGHERGAFTGAVSSSIGKLQQAHEGTVFLDEVGELSLSAQPKLLRAIEQHEVQRLGGRPQAIDVRWLAATNRDLEAMARNGLFRADLFYRLNVFTVQVPPLRERRDDISLLANHFLATLCRDYRRHAAFSPATLARLARHDWPGNVRELRNAVEHSLIDTDGDTIHEWALPLAVRGASHVAGSCEPLERVRLIDALRAADGNKTIAAQKLRWSRMTLYRKLVRYGIDVTATCNSVTAGSSHK